MARSRLTRSKKQYVQAINRPAKLLAATIKGAIGTPKPSFIEPSLATLWPKSPTSEGWVHEIKFDGYRFQVHLDAGQVRFFTRRGHDWTDRIGNLRAAAARISADSAVLDGEVVVQSPDGRPDFHALEKELRVQGGSERLTYFLFDALYVDGFDLRDAALIDRKRVLELLLPDKTPQLQFSAHVEGATALPSSVRCAA
jgi:bifunctional non-homologous end joining protein LigD